MTHSGTKKRPKRLTVVGCLNIALGASALLYAALFFFALLHSSSVPANAARILPGALHRPATLLIACMAIDALASALLVVSGIAVLILAGWAPRLTTVAACLKIVLNTVFTVSFIRAGLPYISGRTESTYCMLAVAALVVMLLYHVFVIIAVNSGKSSGIFSPDF